MPSAEVSFLFYGQRTENSLCYRNKEPIKVGLNSGNKLKLLRFFKFVVAKKETV